MISSPSENCPGVELLIHVTFLFSIFWGISILFFLVAELIYIPINNAQRFPFLRILSNTYFLFFWGGWGRMRAGGKGGRGWDGRMVSSTQWTWVWANSVRWWRTEKPGILQSTGSQRVRHDWATVSSFFGLTISWITIMIYVFFFLIAPYKLK